MIEYKKTDIFKYVVEQDLCVGCGICVVECCEHILSMKWNEEGFLVPEMIGNCKNNCSCINVCPFNPFPDNEVRTENEIADIFLKETPHSHSKIGYFYTIYAGYSKEFRLTSSSGGMATYVAKKLLENKIVDHIISVTEGDNDNFYKYSIISSANNIRQASKTKYYPVTLAEVLANIENTKGKIAVVGVACFIKAIRLYQYYHPTFKEKIPFLIGIICGGMKSKFFTEYLAGKAGIRNNRFLNPEYRIKDYNSKASDYSFGCVDCEENQHKVMKMRRVGDMWGTGLFKANACDFCDDVTTELSDISLGDAWLWPYNKDGKGTNVIITRSKLADDIINEGINNKELFMDILPVDHFLSSQRGSFNHRHKGLKYRMEYAQKKGKIIPPKRHNSEKITIDFQWVQRQRMLLRIKSLSIWRTNKNATFFDSEIKKDVRLLHKITRLYHCTHNIFGKMKKK